MAFIANVKLEFTVNFLDVYKYNLNIHEVLLFIFLMYIQKWMFFPYSIFLLLSRTLISQLGNYKLKLQMSTTYW